MNPYGRHTTAILPTRTNLNPATPMKNEFHVSWSGRGTYLVLSQGAGFGAKFGQKRHIILSGSGDPSGYPEVGSRIDAHHDQTMKQLGTWVVEQKASHEDVATLRTERAVPLYVYK